MKEDFGSEGRLTPLVNDIVAETMEKLNNEPIIVFEEVIKR